MRDAEQMWAVVAGAFGLVSFVFGSIAVRAPAVDAPTEEALADLRARRGRVLAGSVAAVFGAGLLLWPLSVVAMTRDADTWRSLAAFSIATWVFGFGFLAFGWLLLVVTVWRTDGAMGDGVARAFLDLSHLAMWSISAPVGALSVIATTVVGVQAELFGWWVVVAASLKVATGVVEVAGTGRQTGWNAGGWARGSSGSATVAWFVLVLIALL